MDFGQLNGGQLSIEPFDVSEDAIRARVTFRQHEFAAAILITDELYAIPGGGRPDEFFRSLADNWRGWDGEKEWWDIGSSLHVRAKHNRINSVTLLLELSESFGTLTLNGEVVIELGQLDKLAAHLEAIFIFPTPPPRFEG